MYKMDSKLIYVILWMRMWFVYNIKCIWLVIICYIIGVIDFVFWKFNLRYVGYIVYISNKSYNEIRFMVLYNIKYLDYVEE